MYPQVLDNGEELEVLRCESASLDQVVVLGLESTPLFLSFVFYALCLASWDCLP